MQQAHFSRSAIVSIEVGVEASLLIIATIWIWVTNLDLRPLIIIKDAWPIALGIGLGVLMNLSSLVLARLISKFKGRLKYFADLDAFVLTSHRKMYKEVTPLDIFLLAFSSGFCEEIFFRGVLQSQLGLVPAAVIFCVLFQCCNYKALVAGLIYGVSLQVSGCLWVPIAAHVVNQIGKISMIRYQISKAVPDQQEM